MLYSHSNLVGDGQLNDHKPGASMLIGTKGIGMAALVAATLIPAYAGQGVPIGPATRFESGVQSTFLSTDNVYATTDNEVDATAFLLSPRLGLYYAPSDGLFSLVYAGEIGEYDSSSEDDYIDHRVGLSAALRPYAKHSFEFSAGYTKEHDRYGTVRTAGRARVPDAELDKWDSASGAAKYTYGSESARLNWFLRGSIFDKEYTTNEFDPIFPGTGARFLSRRHLGVGTGITYKLTPRTKLLVDIEHVDIDYDTDLNPPLDGTLDRAFVGIRWLAAAKTTGEFWIGRFARDFDDSSRGKGEGGSWLAKVTWSPRTYTNVVLDTGQATEEAVLRNENFIDRQHIGLRWNYDWSYRFATFIRYRRTNDTYEGTPREDDIDEYGAGARFELSSYYQVQFSVSQFERDSNFNLLDYQRNQILLSLNASF